MYNSKVITNWNLFNLKEEQDNIRKYFFEKYPNKINIVNSLGWIAPNTLNKLLVFARKRKDDKLKELILDFVDKLKKIEIEKDIKKYNI
jgi:archaellum component FlaD/FlaE